MPPEAAIGQQAGAVNQGTQAIAVGKQAGYQNQGANAVAIGAYAGFSNQAAGSIVLNASGANVNATTSGFYVNPVRSVTSSSGLVSYSANEMTVTSNVIMNTVTATTFVGNGSQLTGVFTPMTISNVQITSNTWTVLDDTAVSVDGGYCLVNGSGFAPGSLVTIGTDFATATTYISSTQLRVQLPAKSSGSYNVTVIRGDTVTATLALGITYSPFPVWSTSTDLGNVTQNISFTKTLAASSDSNVTYANTSALPPQTTLASNGTLSGNITSVSSDTMYTFNIKATDLEYQDVLRTFQMLYLLGFAVTDIVAGDNFSFVIAGKRAYGFGYNGDGRLGTGNTTNVVSTPTNIMSQGSLVGKSVSKIACGTNHTLVLCTDNTLCSFGGNYWGQLGTSTNSNTGNANSVPINITSNGSLSGKTITEIACGNAHSLVKCSDGSLHSFGYNTYGQLGINGFFNNVNPDPTNITTNGSLSGKTISTIACGEAFAIILCTDGSVHSFGANYRGQLGTTTNVGTLNANPIPINISSNGSLNGKTVSKIACGYEHVIALCTDGTLHSFGRNNNGQLGTTTNSGTDTTNPTPYNITSQGSLNGKTASSISCGNYHTVILCTDGTLHTFGNNRTGQLGTSTNLGTTTANPTPVDISSRGSLSGKTALKIAGSSMAVTYGHTLVLCTDRTLHSFGDNYYGQLASTTTIGTDNGNPTPENVTASVVQ